MRHLVKGRKLNRTKSHREAMFKNMATSLFEHKKLHTTEAKAKELKPIAEKLITKAKNALANEKQNLLPEGQTVDIHNRRQVGRYIRNKAVLQELFDAIAPVVEGRNGGYTRVVKTGTRRGDAARTAIIELVDWGAPQDGTISNKPAKRKRDSQKKKSSRKESSVAKITTKEEVKEVKDEEVVTTIETAAVEETDVTTAEVVETAEDITSATEETPDTGEIKEEAEAQNEEEEVTVETAATEETEVTTAETTTSTIEETSDTVEIKEETEAQNEEVATVETATEETEVTTTEATAEDTTSETGETSADTEENQEKEI